MKQPIDLALRFLLLADRDIRTLQLLLAASDSDDQALGFHAQQAIEKCLKAVLSAHGVGFRRTHDLLELLDLLRDSGQPTPPNAESLESLNPFAVTLRYDFFEVEALDRDWISAAVQTVRTWAESQIDIPKKSADSDTAIEP